MNRDTNDTDRQREAPEGWEGYAAMLREYGEGRQTPDSLRERQTLEGWDDAIADRQRQRMVRWGIGLPTGMLVVSLIGLLTFGSRYEINGSGQEPVVRVADPPEQMMQEDVFASPEIPPVWIDSLDAAIEFPPLGILDIDAADSLFSVSPVVDSPVTGE